MGTRRDFLKGFLASGAAVTAGAVATPTAARETRPRPPEALGLLYDATLCVGCKACVAACKESNENPPEFSPLDHLWDTPLDTSGYTFNIIKMYRNGTMEAKDQEVNGFAFMKTSCMHCGDPSCVSACPVSAMTKDPETGVVGYNPDKPNASFTKSAKPWWPSPSNHPSLGWRHRCWRQLPEQRG